MQGETWLVALVDTVQVMTAAELEVACESGMVMGTTMVWIAGMVTWEPLATIAAHEDGLPLANKASSRRSWLESPSVRPASGTPADGDAPLWLSLRRESQPSPSSRPAWLHVPKLSRSFSELTARHFPWPRRATCKPIIVGCAVLCALTGSTLAERWSAASGERAPVACCSAPTSMASGE
jgi:hypothetical protein